MHLVRRHAEAARHQVVRFANELHVAIFDAVVNHFHVVTGAIFADPIATGRPIVHLRRDGLEDGFDMRPRRGRTAGHDARAVPRAFLAPGHARADIKQAFRLHVFRAAIGVFEKRVAAVDDDVAGFQSREEMFDELIDGFAGLDHEHDAAGFFEERDHFLDGAGADDIRAFGFPGQELVHLGDRAVESHHGVAVIVHIQDEILAHDGQTDECDVRFRFHVQFC